MFSVAKKLLCGAAFLFALAASANHTGYPDESRSTRTTVTVHVIWLADWKATTHFCSWIGGTYPPRPDYIIYGCYAPWRNTIIAVEPRNFNDHKRLEILGHEFWHALGAKHPE